MKSTTYNEISNQQGHAPASGGVQSKVAISSIPVTNENPKRKLATASIYVDGLSVLCPNSINKTVEIAFVEGEHTPVRIEIRKSSGGFVAAHDCPLGQKVNIEIKKSRPKEIGKLYKNSKSEDEDFDWMPDLNGPDWHPGIDLSIRPQAKNHLSAKLVLRDATFYTELKSRSKAKQTNKRTGEIKNLTVGRVLGANIVCEAEDEGIVLTTSSGFNPQLPKAGGPYIITVRTRSEHEHDHLHLLYEQIIEVSDGHPGYEFEYVTREPIWSPWGIIGDSRSNVYYEASSQEAGEIPDGDKVIFKTIEDAEKKEFKPAESSGITSTEFVCQTFPGGEGPLPAFP
ncbi:MAG: hypothetical protein LC768_06370 [Acidobacteria bacterium]|nr:hypothetical protein [Acidobacteriota bacterium]MCA1637948.1 hypothetical protein [Acidobacteriota bacterium]